MPCPTGCRAPPGGSADGEVRAVGHCVCEDTRPGGRGPWWARSGEPPGAGVCCAGTPCLPPAASGFPPLRPRPNPFQAARTQVQRRWRGPGRIEWHKRTATGLLGVRTWDSPAAASVPASAPELEAPVKPGLGPRRPPGLPGVQVSAASVWAAELTLRSTACSPAQPRGPFTVSHGGVSQGFPGSGLTLHTSCSTTTRGHSQPLPCSLSCALLCPLDHNLLSPPQAPGHGSELATPAVTEEDLPMGHKPVGWPSRRRKEDRVGWESQGAPQGSQPRGWASSKLRPERPRG